MTIESSDWIRKGAMYQLEFETFQSSLNTIFRVVRC